MGSQHHWGGVRETANACVDSFRTGSLYQKGWGDERGVVNEVFVKLVPARRVCQAF